VDAALGCMEASTQIIIIEMLKKKIIINFKKNFNMESS
jgi:hypothetical protein